MTTVTRPIVHALGFAALMLAVSLGARLAFQVGWVDDAELSRRLGMVVFGAFYLFTGNQLPKSLTPLASLRCSAVATQSLQRLMGWTQVLAGLVVMLAWIVLPTDTAQTVTVVAITGGVVIVLAQIARLRWFGRRPA
jgi:hypothetical protein